MAKSDSGAKFLQGLRDAITERDAGAFFNTLRDAVIPEDAPADAHYGLTDRDRYVLQHAPTILAALVMRRQSTNPDQMVEHAIDGVRKIYDVIHEMDTPATTMLSQPVDATDHKDYGERVEEAMQHLRPYIHRADDGTFRCDITKGVDDALDIDPVIFADLTRSLEHTNQLILRGEIKSEDVDFNNFTTGRRVS